MCVVDIVGWGGGLRGFSVVGCVCGREGDDEVNQQVMQ